MANRRIGHAGRGVGHEGEGQDLNPRVPGDHCLGDGGHPHHVGPERPEHQDLGRSLVARTRKAGVDAREQPDSQVFRFLRGEPSKPMG